MQTQRSCRARLSWMAGLLALFAANSAAAQDQAAKPTADAATPAVEISAAAVLFAANEPLSPVVALLGEAGAPETTGSLSETWDADPEALLPLLAAVVPEEAQDPLTTWTPATATPATPGPGPSATPTSPDGKGATAPPVSVGAPNAPALPPLANQLRLALDALTGLKVSGRDAAEIRKLRAGIASFYIARGFAPVWIGDGKPNAAAQAVLAQLAHAGDDGISVEDLPAPVFAAGDGDDKLARAELDLSQQAVAYARRAAGSRVSPLEIAPLIGAKPELPEPADILSTVSAAGADAGSVLAEFNPPQPGYRALRDKLAEVRRETQAASPKPIPEGPVLKVGMSDPRVPLIRARFGLDSAAAAPGELYDTKVAAAVAEFQKSSGLPASGTLTARTVAALAGGPPMRLEDQLIANMEMWRWMPRRLAADRIEVNIPNYEVTVFRADAPVWRSRVVVGKPQTPTPIFSNVMKFLIVNPYWNVPPSILRKEMLPHLAQDPAYFARMGYEVLNRHGHLIVRQPPGERNALGRIKFMFPNDYSVYLHDTPSRSLFGQAKRAFSHGCVRVDEPFNFAQAVLGDTWTIPRIKHLIGGSERYVNLPEPLPIHIEYFTAFVDQDGRLQLRDDIYGYMRKMDVALGLAK